MKTLHLLSTFHYLPDNSATGGGKQHGEHAQGLVQTRPDQDTCLPPCVCVLHKQTLDIFQQLRRLPTAAAATQQQEASL